MALSSQPNERGFVVMQNIVCRTLVCVVIFTFALLFLNISATFASTLHLNRVQLAGRVVDTVDVTLPDNTSDRVGIYLDNGTEANIFVECRNAAPYYPNGSPVYTCEEAQPNDCVEFKGRARPDSTFGSKLVADYMWFTSGCN